MSRGKINGGRHGLARPRVIKTTLKSSVLQENKLSLFEKTLMKDWEEENGRNFDRIITQFQTSGEWEDIKEDITTVLYCWQPIGARVSDLQAKKALRKSNVSQAELKSKKKEMQTKKDQAQDEIFKRILQNYYTHQEQEQLVKDWQAGYDLTVLELLAQKHPLAVLQNEQIPVGDLIELFDPKEQEVKMDSQSQRRWLSNDSYGITAESFEHSSEFQEMYHDRLFLELVTNPSVKAPGKLVKACQDNMWQMTLKSLAQKNDSQTEELLANSMKLWRQTLSEDINKSSLLPEIGTESCSTHAWNKLRNKAPKCLPTKERLLFREARELVEEKFAVSVALKVIKIDKNDMDYEWIQKAKTRALNKVRS